MSTRPIGTDKRRNNNLDLLKIVEKFTHEMLEKIEGTRGNIRYQIEGDDYASSLSSITSSPYLLASLCALFNGLYIETFGQENYKVTWQTIIKHKETGHVVTFYDFKGAASFGSDISGDDTPKSFIKDLKKLIEVLKDDRCPHPYDGIVVGEVA